MSDYYDPGWFSDPAQKRQLVRDIAVGVIAGLITGTFLRMVWK